MTTENRIFWAQFMGAVLVYASVLFVFGFLKQPPPPAPVFTYEITETQIRKEVENEQKAKAFKQAVRAVSQVYHRTGCRKGFADLTARVALDTGVSPRLLAALVFVESGCNPNAKDGLGSIGLTQVNSKVWGKKNLRDPETNLRVGARILANYIRRFGLVEGLHHYNGYSDVHEHVYVNKVLTAAGFPASIQKGMKHDIRRNHC